jgi:replicative DNA helicase
MNDLTVNPPNLAAEALAQLKPTDEENFLVSLLTTITTRNLRDEALAQVEPDDFSDGALGGLWTAALKLQSDNKQINARSLAATADTRGQLAEITLARFTSVVPNPRDFPHALAEVLRCSSLRKIVLATITIQQRTMAAGDGSEALAWAHDELGKLDTAADKQSKHTHDFRSLLTELDTSLRTKENFKVVPSPWDALNERIAGGLHAGRMYIIGARPGEGKSIVAHQAAEHAASLGHPAAIFSVEMGAAEVAGRIVANGASIEMGEISRRDLSARSWQQFSEYRERAQEFPLIINDRPDLTLGYIAAECRAHKRRGGLDVVVIDYLQLVKGERNVSREQQVAGISRGLKQLSRELDIAVVVPAQLNRGPAARGKAMLSDLRESGGIEADADVVLLLARQVDEKDNPTGFLGINLAKNRHGRIGELELPWRPHYSRIG